jgi:hypothetical protein
MGKWLSDSFRGYFAIQRPDRIETHLRAGVGWEVRTRWQDGRSRLVPSLGMSRLRQEVLTLAPSEAGGQQLVEAVQEASSWWRWYRLGPPVCDLTAESLAADTGALSLAHPKMLK